VELGISCRTRTKATGGEVVGRKMGRLIRMGFFSCSTLLGERREGLKRLKKMFEQHLKAFLIVSKQFTKICKYLVLFLI
jgi:hypothetical protein